MCALAMCNVQIKNKYMPSYLVLELIQSSHLSQGDSEPYNQ